MSNPTRDDIAQWLRLFVQPGMVIELRMLGVVDNPKYPQFTLSGYFDHDHLDALARSAMEYTGKAEGCYVTLNPVLPDLLARSANRVKKCRKDDKGTSAPEILRRTGLVFDADPKRPPGISATATEKTEAQERILKLRDDLTRRGWPAPMLADSGNGFHLRYAIDLANNEGARDLVERVQKGIAARLTDDKVKFDPLFDANRIIKLYGTKARKGDDVFARPHRWSRVLEAPDPLEVVPVELLEALAAEYQPPARPEVNSQPRVGSFLTSAGTGASPEVRARAYVFAPGFPDSIAGENGHDRLYHVASVLVDGFGLTRAQALPIFEDWNRDKAKPPESDKQIQHKLDDAIKNHPSPSLEKLNAPLPGASRGSPSGSPAAAGSAPWPPLQFQEPPPLLPFPVEVFPPRLQAFCREVAQSKLAPLDFVGASMLTVAGAAIGQSFNIKIKQDWFEAALFYMMLVARSGKAKSPAMSAVVEPLRKINARLRKESEEAREEWVKATKAHDKNPDDNPPPGPEPPQLRAMTKDITRETLAIILKDNARGVLCYRSEAAAWVKSFNEYKGKGGSDREFWLSLYDREPIETDRKGGRESTYVPFPFCAMLGGLPPSKLWVLADDVIRMTGWSSGFCSFTPRSSLRSIGARPNCLRKPRAIGRR
jgi:hypothetical protein